MRPLTGIMLALLICVTGGPTSNLATAAAVPPPSTGSFVRPVDGPIMRSFLPGESRYSAGHRGVDIATTTDSLVRASGAGTVTAAGWVAGRPVVSVVHSGGLRTTYEPVTPRVRVGDYVSAGQPIGVLRSGHPGCVSGTCLHWGLRRDAPDGDTYLDPLFLLGTGAVRLKPLQPGDTP